MKIADKWLKDLPQQFQGKKRIEVLIAAFAGQMEEVRKVFDDVNQLTDIDTAHGINLDYVGDIVVLSRKDAQVILRSKTDQEPGDELYRQVLRYKAVKNTCDCTYEDIVGTMKLLWDVDYVTYAEKPERPAAIFMQMPPFDIDISDPAEKRVLAVRPAGVGLVYDVSYYSAADHSWLEKMFLVKLRLHWHMPFWGCYVFDGSWNLDGTVQLCQKRRYDLKISLRYYEGIFYELAEVYTKLFDGRWHLDGSVRLDAAYRSFRMRIYKKLEHCAEKIAVREAAGFRIDFWNMARFDGTWNLDGSIQLCQQGRYGLRMGLKYYEGIFYELASAYTKLFDGTWNLDGSVLLDAEYRSSGLRIYGRIKNADKAGSPAVKEVIRFAADFWNLIYFDGRWRLDGKERLNASRCRMETKVKTYITVSSQTEEFMDEPVEIRRNLWFLDGSLNLDGSRMLNAMQRKEVL